MPAGHPQSHAVDHGASATSSRNPGDAIPPCLPRFLLLLKIRVVVTVVVAKLAAVFLWWGESAVLASPNVVIAVLLEISTLSDAAVAWSLGMKATFWLACRCDRCRYRGAAVPLNVNIPLC